MKKQVVERVGLAIACLLVIGGLTKLLEILTGIAMEVWLECICLTHVSLEVSKKLTVK